MKLTLHLRSCFSFMLQWSVEIYTVITILTENMDVTSIIFGDTMYRPLCSSSWMQTELKAKGEKKIFFKNEMFSWVLRIIINQKGLGFKAEVLTGLVIKLWKHNSLYNQYLTITSVCSHLSKQILFSTVYRWTSLNICQLDWYLGIMKSIW